MRDKYKIFLVLCLMLITVITGCGKESKNEPEVTPTPEITTTPTPEPTPTPVEDKYVEISPEEFDRIVLMANEYYPPDPEYPYNWVTCHIVAYYKYIGLDEFLLPVVADYTVSEAEELFGGEWQEMEGRTIMIMDTGNKHNKVWVTGKMTVARLEDELINGDYNRIFVLNDPTVETKYKDGDYSWCMPEIKNENGEREMVSDYMTWLRYWGDLHDSGDFLDWSFQYYYGFR